MWEEVVDGGSGQRLDDGERVIYNRVPFFHELVMSCMAFLVSRGVRMSKEQCLLL